MKQSPKVLGFMALSILILSVPPIWADATQRAITVSSLEVSYRAQVASLDAQIAQADKDYAAATILGSRLTAQSKKNAALDDKHQLEIIYNLLAGALK